MQDDLEVLRTALAADADGVRDGDACPSAEDLWDGARGNLDAERVATLTDHVSSCPACAESWQLAIDVAGEPTAAVVSRTVGARWTWQRWSLVAAAAAAMAIVAVVIPKYRAGVQPTVYRTDATPQIQPLVPDGHTISRNSPLLLRWASAGDGARYNVRVATDDLTVIDHAENLTASERLVPATALTPLGPGTRLVWQVIATLPDGRQISSPASTLIVK